MFQQHTKLAHCLSLLLSLLYSTPYQPTPNLPAVGASFLVTVGNARFGTIRIRGAEIKYEFTEFDYRFPVGHQFSPAQGGQNDQGNYFVRFRTRTVFV
uniref:Putative secreted protein n=1 Tax=Anopheles darlingi TaxID=43151 RepID=A0A2M4DJ55_ANODA